jgi:hypothetical protein
VSIKLTRESLLAYRNRRWDLVQAAKEDFWANEARRGGAAAGLVASEALFEHMRSVDPSWPSPGERQADYEHHMSLVEKLRRVAHVQVR